MKKRFTQTITFFLGSQILIILLSFIFHHDISLLHYINISFYLGSLFILVSLFFYTVQSGFFDVVTRSFRLIFAGKDVTKKQVDEMTPLSKLIAFHYSPFLTSGVLMIFFMLIALYIYYF